MDARSLGLQVIFSFLIVNHAIAWGFYNTIKCTLSECCGEPWIKPNMTALRSTLEEKLHGQHLVTKTVLRAIKGHVDNENPKKALVLSFHGWTGGGKSFVSKIITDNLFAKGFQSKHVHLYVSTAHFPHERYVETYKDQLSDWIKGHVSDCQRSLFIFDEIDKMPRGLIDAIKPFIDHHEGIDSVDYRKAIFIFLSNTAGKEIAEYTLDHLQNGKDREELQLKQLEEIITQRAFHEQGGLWHSTSIEECLINVFIPFLPMERQHVKLCIQDDLRTKKFPVSEDIINKVADELMYFPKEMNMFSKTGCKRVSDKVNLVMGELE